MAAPRGAARLYRDQARDAERVVWDGLCIAGRDGRGRVLPRRDAFDAVTAVQPGLSGVGRAVTTGDYDGRAGDRLVAMQHDAGQRACGSAGGRVDCKRSQALRQQIGKHILFGGWGAAGDGDQRRHKQEQPPNAQPM